MRSPKMYKFAFFFLCFYNDVQSAIAAMFASYNLKQFKKDSFKFFTLSYLLYRRDFFMKINMEYFNLKKGEKGWKKRKN